MTVMTLTNELTQPIYIRQRERESGNIRIVLFIKKKKEKKNVNELIIFALHTYYNYAHDLNN